MATMMYYGFNSETSTTGQFLELNSDKLANVKAHAAQVRSWQQAKRSYYLARLNVAPEDNFDTILRELTSSKSANSNQIAHKWLNQLMAFEFNGIIDLGDHFMKVMLALSQYVTWLPMGLANDTPTSCPRAIINALCDTALYIVAMQFLLKPRMWNDDDIKTMHYAATAICEAYTNADTFSHLVFGPQLLKVACEMLCHFQTKQQSVPQRVLAKMQTVASAAPGTVAVAQAALGLATHNLGATLGAVTGVLTGAKDALKTVVGDSTSTAVVEPPSAESNQAMSVLAYAICGAWVSGKGQPADHLMQRYMDILAMEASTRLQPFIQTTCYMKIFEVIARFEVINRRPVMTNETKDLLQKICVTAIAYCHAKGANAKWAAVRVVRIAKTRLGHKEFPVEDFTKVNEVDQQFAAKVQAYWEDMEKLVSAAQSPAATNHNTPANNDPTPVVISPLVRNQYFPAATPSSTGAESMAADHADNSSRGGIDLTNASELSDWNVESDDEVALLVSRLAQVAEAVQKGRTPDSNDA